MILWKKVNAFIVCRKICVKKKKKNVWVQCGTKMAIKWISDSKSHQNKKTPKSNQPTHMSSCCPCLDSETKDSQEELQHQLLWEPLMVPGKTRKIYIGINCSPGQERQQLCIGGGRGTIPQQRKTLGEVLPRGRSSSWEKCIVSCCSLPFFSMLSPIVHLLSFGVTTLRVWCRPFIESVPWWYREKRFIYSCDWNDEIVSQEKKRIWFHWEIFWIPKIQQCH